MEPKSFLIVLFLTIQAVVGNVDEVTIKQGKLKGVLSESANGKPFVSFLGVPYAQPPVGNLRFQLPQPAAEEGWQGTFHADAYTICLQIELSISKTAMGHEDCLVLNIYTPNVESKELLPVMVYIHGGGFALGSGSNKLYGPERFMDYGIVLVTVNYRLGAFGFLSTGDKELPGNLGLWDQRLALKWVQQNIKAFGGDHTKVTLFGESAGSASVMFHYLSPQSKGLFQFAIGQSGVPNSAFCRTDKHPAYHARTLAANVGCDPKAETFQLRECLQNLDSDVINQQNLHMVDPLRIETHPFKPIVDSFLGPSSAFVPVDPWFVIDKPVYYGVDNRPLILGSNRDEGLILTLSLKDNQTALEEVIENWSREGPSRLFNRNFDEVSRADQEAATAATKFYLGLTSKTQDLTVKSLSKISGDAQFNAINSLTAQKLASTLNTQVYEYLYNHVGTISLIQVQTLQFILKYAAQMVGVDIYRSTDVCHADELFMMFKPHLIPIETVFSAEDRITSHNMLRLWTNFAKTGKPTPDIQEFSFEWTPLSSNALNQRLEIGSAGTLQMTQRSEDEIQFWAEIWAKVPPTLHLQRSATFKDTFLYKANLYKAGNSRDEL